HVREKRALRAVGGLRGFLRLQQAVLARAKFLGPFSDEMFEDDVAPANRPQAPAHEARGAAAGGEDIAKIGPGREPPRRLNGVSETAFRSDRAVGVARAHGDFVAAGGGPRKLDERLTGWFGPRRIRSAEPGLIGN